MSSRITTAIASRLLRSHLHPSTTTVVLHRHFTTATPKPHTLLNPFLRPHHHLKPPSNLRFISTRPGSPRPHRSTRTDIGARARQLQTRRLWTYALTFSCIAGFIIIVLNQFQDQLVFYITPTDALVKYSENPSKSKFRLGGLVLEGSLVQLPSSPEMEFVITDLETDLLVKYQGSLPDLFREGHSVVVEGFVRPFTEDIRAKDDGDSAAKDNSRSSSRSFMVSHKARSQECYFKATEVLAKHDEKYMPGEVAARIEENKKKLMLRQQEEAGAEQATVSGGATGTPAAVA